MPTQQDFFREVTLLVSRRLDVTQMLDDLFSYLRTRMPCDLLQMNYLDQETGELRRLAWVELQHGSRISHKSHTLFAFPEEAMAIIRKGPPKDRILPRVEIMNAGARPEYYPQHPAFKEGFKRFLLEGYNLVFVRMLIEDQDIGALLVAARPPAVYTPEHARLFEEVNEPLSIAFSNARRYEDLLRLKDHLDSENKALSQDLGTAAGAVLVGKLGGLRHIMELVQRVAALASPVLLLGETGTGKEVLAHTLHAMSPRRDKPFVRVQCGAIPEALLDSELFGHEKGAFTGATAQRSGRFERAHQGTLFLDEIGELTPESQVKLLRVLQEKEFERVGGSETLRVDVRVIAATHQDLPERIRQGRFREDLFFRINVFPLTIPPLRQRREDIPQLIQYFVQRKCRDLNLPQPPALDADTLAQLQAYNWPGNVRELQNVVERALIISRNGPLCFPDLGKNPSQNTYTAASQPPSPAQTAGPFPKLSTINVEHIRKAMSLSHGKIKGPGGAAELLGLQDNTLRARLRKLGIPYGRTAIRWSGASDSDMH
jgi:transcriptional regulator with GAF, ATPase, and Fis domain